MNITTNPGQGDYDQHFATIMNADLMWKRSLIDNAKGEIVNNAGTLRHEDHKSIMAQLVEVRRRSLNGITDLRAAGLTSPESIGTQLVGYENINEFQTAKRDMNPTEFQNNNSDFMMAYTPLPITHQSWRIPFRQIGFGYKRSIGLSESVRQVSESLEDMLFNGAPEIQVTTNGSASSIIGYTTAPNRSTYTLLTSWLTGTSGIITDALAMVKLAFGEGAVSRPNSMILYVSNDAWVNLQNDYSATTGTTRTIKERLEAISEIKEVKPAEKLPEGGNGTALLVEMEDRTVQLSVASDIVTIPHIRTSDLDDQVFTTYAVMTPILKSDRNDHMGIVHGLPA